MGPCKMTEQILLLRFLGITVVTKKRRIQEATCEFQIRSLSKGGQVHIGRRLS